MPDKYSAVWVSHSSISAFLECPRSYYLKNIYKDPNTGHKIQIMSPALALGQAVHEVVESLSNLPTEERFKISLIEKFDKVWKKLSGKRGGFFDDATEQKFKKDGEEMLRKIIDKPGPISQLSVKIKESLPYYWISEEDNIILCGKIDWLQYLPDTNSVSILDFKTGKKKEDGSSLQLPIYYLLVTNTQKRKMASASYWYLRLDDKPEEAKLPNLGESHKKVLEIAKKIKLARQLERFPCPNGEKGCRGCSPFEKILRGEAEFVGESEYRQDIYVIPPSDSQNQESTIL